MIRELAENANTYVELGPHEERIEDPRFVIFLGPGSHPAFTVVQRLRLSEGGLEAQVAEIRALVRERGRAACTWEIADSATPAGLADRLLELGCVPESDPVAIGMVLRTPPAGSPPQDVEVRAVETLAEMEAAERIAGEAFGATAQQVEEGVAGAPHRLAEEGVRQRTYLAFVDGLPAARATASFTPHGLLLFGGATLADARGRGAYRALVHARWEDAVARGTPVLVTHAGAMSRPILERLGFEPLATIRILLDETIGAEEAPR